MRHTWLYSLMVVAVLAAQDGPPPGNPSHEPPPDGWFCYTRSMFAPAGHECDCHKECTIDPETKQRVIVEENTCRVWCFKDSCRCVVKCPDTE